MLLSFSTGNKIQTILKSMCKVVFLFYQLMTSVVQLINSSVVSGQVTPTQYPFTLSTQARERALLQ